MKRHRISILALCGTLVFASVGVFISPQEARAITKEIVFPVVGPVSYSDTFGAPRSGGRTHEGADIFGFKRQPLVAAVSGTVRFVASPEPSYGYYISIEAPDGWTYRYLHINNDTPGTDDGNGGEMWAYAPDMRSGNSVTAGQLVGWMGDSGNAEGTSDHLHFEVRDPSGTAVNPTDTLHAARRVYEPATYDYIEDEILPFGNFHGGATIAFGEFHGGHEGKEIVAAAGPRGGPDVKIIGQDREVIGVFRAFEASMRSGMDVTTGNVDGEGLDEIIVAAGENSSPRVRIFNNRGELQTEFLAFEEWFRGGVRIKAADLDGDGKAEILTAPNKDYAPWLKVYDGEGNHVYEFLVYGIGFRGGFDVGASSATEEADAVIVTSAARGGGPHVRVFDKDGNRTSQFFAYSQRYRGGVRIDVANVYEDTDALEIVTVPQGGGPDFRVYSMDGGRVARKTEYETWWRGEFDLAAADGEFFVVSQNSRRVSIRPLVSNK